MTNKTNPESPGSVAEPQTRYSRRGRRLSKRVDVDAAQIEDEDSNDDANYSDKNEDDEDQEANQSSRRKGQRKNVKESKVEKSDSGQGGRGALPQEAKARLDRLMEKQAEEIEAIAREYGKPPEMCYKYVDGGDSTSTRSVSYWNIWQQWYAVHGDQKKPNDSM
jgi:hypothetical protein